MKKWMFAIVLALIVLGTGANGMADTLTLVSVGTGSNGTGPGNIGDNGAAYTYPYNFSIDGSTTLTALMCDDFNDDIYIGETWNVTVNTIGQIMGGAGQMTAASTWTNGILNANQSAYAEAAYLNTLLSGDTTNSQLAIYVNEAVWELFSPAAVFTTDQTAIAGLLSSAQTAIAGKNAGAVDSTFANTVFYTPSCTTNPGTGTSCGEVGNQGSTRPQEFIGTVPEPGSLALLGIGLIGFGIISRKRGFQA